MEKTSQIWHFFTAGRNSQSRQCARVSSRHIRKKRFLSTTKSFEKIRTRDFNFKIIWEEFIITTNFTSRTHLDFHYYNNFTSRKFHISIFVIITISHLENFTSRFDSFFPKLNCVNLTSVKSSRMNKDTLKTRLYKKENCHLLGS